MHDSAIRPRRRARRGLSLVYASVAMVAILMLVSLMVDLGRAQLAKTELRRAVDAAARYGAAGLSSGVTTVQNRVIDAANDNLVDGSPLTLSASNVEFGTWNPATKTFTVLSGSARNGATAVRVSASRNVPTLFAAIKGKSTITIQAQTIATRGTVTPQVLDGDSCPWLAGMPSGSQVAATDGNTQPSRAPAQSPLQLTGFNLTPGQRLSFSEVVGQTSYTDSAEYPPDGQEDWIVAQTAVNGINTTRAPIQSLVGIFLDDRAPNTYAMAGSLDFSTPASRNFNSLSPGLKQVFFIGDGLNSSGQLQEFVVPNGATRLFIGIMDEKGWWWDNDGTISTSMLINSKVQIVK